MFQYQTTPSVVGLLGSKAYGNFSFDRTSRGNKRTRSGNRRTSTRDRRTSSGERRTPSGNRRTSSVTEE